jgi:hypothetical protein
MADAKISALFSGTPVTTPARTDQFPVNQGGVTKGESLEQIKDFIQRTTVGDAAYTILSTDRLVVTSAAFTAARTWTLPAANALKAGTMIIVLDEQRTVTATNTLTIARAGTDTIEGGAASIVLASGGANVRLMSDGSSKWSLISQKRSVNIQVFTASGTYTPAIGARSAHFRLIGGGGAGGSSAGAASSSGAGGGGASGSYLEKVIDLYLATTAFTVTIGAAGAAAASGNNAGGTGGNTTVAATGITTLQANGGTGGAGSGTAAATFVITAGGAAPTAPSTGDLNTQGQAGGTGLRVSATVAMPGWGAASPFGDGAPPPTGTATSAGVAAIAYGAGGSGALSIGNSNAAGGAGKAGVVVVTEFF